MLKSELDEHLYYEYGDTPLRLNTRNGYSTKKVKSSAGEIKLKIPRDRQGTFEPYVIKKYEKDISKNWTLVQMQNQCMQKEWQQETYQDT